MPSPTADVDTIITRMAAAEMLELAQYGLVVAHTETPNDLIVDQFPLILHMVAAQGGTYGMDTFQGYSEMTGSIQPGTQRWTHHIEIILLLGGRQNDLGLLEKDSRKWITYVPKAFLKHYQLGGYVQHISITDYKYASMHLTDGEYVGLAFMAEVETRPEPTMAP